jgi:hypothetical protein
MGFNQEKTDTPSVVSSDVTASDVTPETVIEKTSSSVDTSESQLADEKTPQKDVKYVCDNCYKSFVTQKNLEKHLTTVKCRKKSFVIDDENLPIIFKSKTEHRKIVRLPKPPKIDTVPQTRDVPSHKQNIKYIVKENYVDYLAETLGSQDAALKFIRTCIQTKIRGGINLLYKVYFEGKEYNDYPIEVIDAKNKKIYYKTPDKIELDENALHVKTILIENLRNCYLQFCNLIISANLEDNDVIFDDYDLAEIQNHILELSEEKKKDRIILGLIEQVKK